jgi:hypothetical protein
MTKIEYQDLCRDICRELDLSNIAALAETGNVEIDGIKLFTHFDPQTDATSIYCYVDIAGITNIWDVEILKNILKTNLTLDGANSETLGLNDSGDRLYLRAKIPCYEGLNGAQMAEWFRDYVAFAKKINVDVFDLPSAKNISLYQLA